MLKRVLRVLVFVLPLLTSAVAATDGPIPGCYPCCAPDNPNC